MACLMLSLLVEPGPHSGGEIASAKGSNGESVSPPARTADIQVPPDADATLARLVNVSNPS
jgi:hypothetical protein